MNYSIEDIAKIVNGKFISNGNKSTIIKNLLIDSRNLIAADNSLFFALSSKRNDGHKYIEELYRKGVCNFIISDSSQLENGNWQQFKDANFIIVPNTLKALQALATAHRKHFKYPVIGITGSNGKTIIKEWLFQLMNEDKKIVRSPKSYNSQIGVPLSVWLMDEDNDLGIFEAGISQPEEMSNLQNIIQPTIGLFTNIGQAHDENFINTNHKIGEKLQLFTKGQKLIYCSDYKDIKERILKSGIFRKEALFSWSKQNDADLIIEKINKTNKNTQIIARLHDKTDNLIISIPFTDDASIENAIHCWATMLFLGYTNEVVVQRMLLLTPVAMRLELKEGINNCSLIDDYYNLDINSLNIALNFLNTQKQHDKKTVILSDILQSGRNENELYTEVAGLLKEKNINRIIGIGNALSKQADKFDMEKSFFETTESFLNTFSVTSLHNETILLKGARMFQFESISSTLQQKTHETTLEINLGALIHNLNYYRSLLKPESRIVAMVKAFSYGSGSFEIANTLQFHHIDYLAVAYTDEGSELRKAGITVPIIVMNPEEESFDTMIKYSLEPEIYNFRNLDLLDKALKRNLLTYDNAISVHVKLDTGMYRLGFEEKDIPQLIKYLNSNKQIHVTSVFSHLVASYDPRHDDFTRQQIDRFNKMSGQIVSSFDYPIMRHLLNSAGIIRFPEAQFDMVRLGIGLYGVSSTDEENKYLENVSSLKTIISQIKYVPSNETIGYGREYKAPNDMKIAVLPIGYADGLSRRLSNGKGKVFIKGKKANIVGNVSMDMCMVDITDINVDEGDEVIIFGNEYPISNIAEQLGTIPYEVLTSVSRRVKRVYFQE